MTMQSKRATVYLDHDLHKALRLKAVETSTSVSELINKAIREAIAVSTIGDVVDYRD